MGVGPVVQQNYTIGIASPVGTTVIVGGTSLAAIASNAQRRGIIFINPGAAVILYVCPANIPAVIGQGVPIYPGAQVQFLGDPERLIAFNAGWNAIAATGSSNPLTILELL